MVTNRHLLARLCLAVLAITVLAVGAGVTAADHDPGEPHGSNSSDGTSSTTNVTWDSMYWTNQTVETSGDGHQWTVDYQTQLFDVAETSDGSLVYTGWVSRWNGSIDGFQRDAVVLTTDSNGTQVTAEFYGYQPPESAARQVSCPDVSEIPDGFARELVEGQLDRYTGPGRPHLSDPRCSVESRDPERPSSEEGTQDTFRSYDDEGYDLATTDDGGVVFVGRAASVAPKSVFNNSDPRLWVVKTDADGDQQWNRTFEERGGDFETVIQTDDGGYLIAGRSAEFGSYEDLWLVKLGADGTTEWERGYGGPEDDRAHDLIETSDGNYAIAGETYSYTLRGDRNYNDAWLLVVNDQGDVLVNETYTGADSAGDRAFESARAIVEHSDGGFALAGETDAFSDGNQDAWLIRTDEDGQVMWNQSYGATDSSGSIDDEIARDLVETPDGGLLLATSAEADDITTQQESTWLVRTDDSGSMLWNEAVPGGRINRPNSLLATGGGEYVLTISQLTVNDTDHSRALGITDPTASTDSSNATATDGPNNTSTATPSTTTPSTATPSTSASGPGFGITAALLAVALVVGLRYRR